MIQATQPLKGKDWLAISNSEVGTWKNCRRRWLLGYYLGLQVPPHRESATSTSKHGTRMHAALEGLYGHGLDPMDTLRAIYTKAAEEFPGAGDDLRKEYDLSVAMMEGYYEWLAEDGKDAGLEPIAAEHVQQAWLGKIEDVNVWVQCKLDVVLRRKEDGKILFMDHKNVGDFSKLALLPMDEQMKTQTLIQRLAFERGTGQNYGYLVDGVLYNMLRRSKRTARATPPFYHRESVFYNDADMMSMKVRLNRTVRDIIIARKALDAFFSTPVKSQAHAEARTYLQQAEVFPTPSGDCSWRCPFNKECIMMDDGSRWEDALTGNFIRKENPYEYWGNDLLQILMREGRVHGV